MWVRSTVPHVTQPQREGTGPALVQISDQSEMRSISVGSRHHEIRPCLFKARALLEAARATSSRATIP